ncbi:MAG: hypothetical protein WBA89_07125 [Microcoleus sp.]|uniref:hypothetical protein n=1 Tax=Microcoleus sp. TaxID=44472 RepID=UPI003C784B6A
MTVDIPKAENPVMKWAGAFKNDPHFDEMLEDIAFLRKMRCSRGPKSIGHRA